MKPVKRAFLVLTVVTILFWGIFEIILIDTQNLASELPVPIYSESWAYELGRDVDQRTATPIKNALVKGLEKGKDFKMNLSVCYLADNIFTTEHYHETRLSVKINQSEPIVFCLGYRSTSQVQPGTSLSGMNWDCFRKTWGFTGANVIISMPLEKRLRKPKHSTWDFWTYLTPQADAPRVHVFVEEDLRPCIFWNGTLEGVEFRYKEVWKYKPVLDYDRSAQERGAARLSLLTPVAWSVGVCQLIIALVLAGLWRNNGGGD